MYSIYRLEYGLWFYYGSTKQTPYRRNQKHYSNCFNPTDIKKYNRKIYKKLRELTTIDNYYKKINILVLHDNLTIQQKKEYEGFYLDFNRDNPYLLNDDKLLMKHGETLLEYKKRYYNRNRQEKIDKSKANYRKNMDSKKYHCNLCNKTYPSNYKLKIHYTYFSHQWNYLHSQF